jgi:hypothetical protein
MDMNDLQNAVHASFANLVASGAVEKMIEEQLASTIQSVIKGSLREYSDFGKNIEAAVKKALNVNFDHLGLPGYNDFILKLIRANVDAQMEQAINSNIAERMAELLAAPPAEIKFSEFLADFIEENTDDDGSNRGEQISLHIEKKYNITWVAIDKDADTKEYSCDVRFGVDDDGKILSIRLGGKELEKSLFVGPLHGLEKKLFQIHAAGSKVILDQGTDAEDYETNYPDYD